MKPHILSTETVQQAIEEAGRWIATGIRVDLDEWAEETDDEMVKMESPIEAVFAVWWQVIAWARRMQATTEGLWLEPQYEVDVAGRRYRLDFSIGPEDPDDLWMVDKHNLGIASPRIAVELDGHDFHERTKEQVALRNLRDRDLQEAGWKVFHFSGSEIHRSAITHVSRVFDYAEGQWGAFRLAVRKAMRARGIRE